MSNFRKSVKRFSVRNCAKQRESDKHLSIDYMTRMIHLTASFWYFSYGSSLAAGGLRSI